MITGDVGVTTLKLSFIGVCLMGDPVGIGRAHDCPILTVETEHLSNIMDKDEKTATQEVEKIFQQHFDVHFFRTQSSQFANLEKTGKKGEIGKEFFAFGHGSPYLIAQLN